MPRCRATGNSWQQRDGPCFLALKFAAFSLFFFVRASRGLLACRAVGCRLQACGVREGCLEVVLLLFAELQEVVLFLGRGRLVPLCPCNVSRVKGG